MADVDASNGCVSSSSLLSFLDASSAASNSKSPVLLSYVMICDASRAACSSLSSSDGVRDVPFIGGGGGGSGGEDVDMPSAKAISILSGPMSSSKLDFLDVFFPHIIGPNAFGGLCGSSSRYWFVVEEVGWRKRSDLSVLRSPAVFL